MKIPKMAKVVYRQMPAPRAKARMQKPQGGSEILVQMPGVRGGMVMDEIDTCVSLTQHTIGGPVGKILGITWRQDHFCGRTL